MKRATIVGVIGVTLIATAALGAAKAAMPHDKSASAPCTTTCVTREGMSMTGMSGVDASPMPATSDMPSMQSGNGRPPDMTAGMGPHMRMTPEMPSHPGDADRAQKVVDALRGWIGKYQDYRLAEQAGYVPFLPNIPQKQYHFTNYNNAMAAQTAFDPTRPTSLLYEKTADGYKLIGAMYTAPRAATLADLDARVPLSIAHWHEHVNFCKGPAGSTRDDYLGPHAKFGLEGSISTEDACRAAGGTFIPVIFNWMVHVYPYERNTSDIWKVGH
ncbi:MAG TPA: hypothetical protein VFO25_08640 [Candidatus Eremiobacteraceae bacterium]|nr:hypothetical protein [Candidatus Eremiobacteraceae bacterium]